MTSAQEAADLQAAMDASAAEQQKTATAAAPVSASASGAAGPPAVVFSLVTDLAAFKTQTNAQLKRLQDCKTH